MKELPTPTFSLSPVSLPKGMFRRPAALFHGAHPTPVAQTAASGLVVSWAQHADEIAQAQRLRYRVFAQEMGARLDSKVPGQSEILGQKCYASLRDIPQKVGIVDCFRKSEDIPPLAEEAIAIGAKVFWLQLGVINPTAAQRAADAGLAVVVDRCVKIEHARLFGGLHWAGVNTGVISAKRAPCPPLAEPQ